jgi:hypothetical protein
MGSRVLSVHLLVRPDASLPTLTPTAAADASLLECARISALASHPDCIAAARATSADPLALAVPPWLRAYVHCARRGPPGALTALLINLNGSHAIDVSMTTPHPSGGGAATAGGTPLVYRGRRVEHELFARSLRSKHTRQGDGAGRRLTLDVASGATNLEERVVPAGSGHVIVRPWSILFVEMPGAQSSHCM